MKNLLLIAALTIGLWNLGFFLFNWWRASQNEWKIIVDLNSRGEAIVEGVIAHLSLVVVVVALGLVLRQWAKGRQP